ncbi:anaerobic ribonucleoside-triphosphate reductase activating protein [Calderihabitans maritimus]|uniref:Anaerobic ribonucleoside-triphosphate reductase activating protein n=1 Tax=Calderihabitans maritimus TaxID=1246530 RepID=A0A1Z5HN65_9FIRM|nr:anaerobic ribonucleoside-triphosphate reductase activating protein [Calderihabitans maritimus]
MNLLYRGSRNQRTIDVQRSLMQGKDIQDFYIFDQELLHLHHGQRFWCFNFISGM